MNTIFILTLVFVFLAVFVESIVLILQLKGKKLSKWFGKNAFHVHMIVTLSFWGLAFCLVIALQFVKSPSFHNNILFKLIGFTLLISGLIIAVWGFWLLGLKRSLCLNFFEDNVPVVNHSLYKSIKNPEDTGFWLALFGLALFTGSVYNLIVAVEFIVLMIPHQMLENVPLNKEK
ncbi:MAG: methyltransferase [Candidatus Aminicenantaceae bacterium]